MSIKIILILINFAAKVLSETNFIKLINFLINFLYRVNGFTLSFIVHYYF